MKLFARFFLILLLFAFVPVLAMSIWILNSNIAVQENSQQLHRQIAQLTAAITETAVSEMNRSLAFVEDLERNEAKDPSLDAKSCSRWRAIRTAPRTRFSSASGRPGSSP